MVSIVNMIHVLIIIRIVLNVLVFPLLSGGWVDRGVGVCGMCGVCGLQMHLQHSCKPVPLFDSYLHPSFHVSLTATLNLPFATTLKGLLMNEMCMFFLGNSNKNQFYIVF